MNTIGKFSKSIILSVGLICILGVAAVVAQRQPTLLPPTAANAYELSSVFRRVSRAALPAIVTIESRRTQENQNRRQAGSCVHARRNLKQARGKTGPSAAFFLDPFVYWQSSWFRKYLLHRHLIRRKLPPFNLPRTRPQIFRIPRQPNSHRLPT